MRRDGRVDQARKLLDEFMASELTERVRAYIAVTASRLIAAAEGPRQIEQAGVSGGPERTGGDEGPEREPAFKFAPVPRRLRTARTTDPALRGKWNFNALAAPREVAMSHEDACRWHRNRLEDAVLSDHVLIDALKALGAGPNRRHFAARGVRNFARALTDADKGDSLSAFLARAEDLQGDKEQEENKELAMFLLGFDDTKHDQQESSALKLALEILRHIPLEERNAEPLSEGSSFVGLVDQVRLRKSLPPHELALIAKVESNGKCQALVRFSSSLLLDGYGGLTEWLAMHKDGRVELARKLLMDKFQRSTPRGLSALAALQKVSGIEPGLRIRIEGSRTYMPDLATAMQAGARTASTPGGSRVPEREAPCIERVMTREDALQWFRNRKDDAILIDGVYLGRCGGDRELGATHGYDDPNLGTDELDLFSRFGTPSRRLLPPDDEALVALLADDEPIRSNTNDKKVFSYTTAATRFVIVLLEKGIGGLSEWLAMQRDDASLEDKAEAKVLLESILPTLPSRSTAREKIFVALRRLQELTSVDSAFTIKRNHPRGAQFRPVARPHKRQRSEGSSAAPTLDGGPSSAERHASSRERSQGAAYHLHGYVHHVG